MNNVRLNFKLNMISIVLLTTIMPFTVALAQDFGPCTGDVMKFCQGVQLGQGDVSRCLTQNRQSLSAGCQSRISALTEQVKEADQACQDDIILYCSDVQPGGGRVKQCLQERDSWLSFNCRVKMGLIGFKTEN